MRRTFLLAVGAATISLQTALPSEFDQCVLQHMQGATSDLAATSVKESCLRTVEVPLAEDTVAALTGAGNQAHFWQFPASAFGGGTGALAITLNNVSGYTLTELSIMVLTKETGKSETYRVRSFPNYPPNALVGLPRDPTILKKIEPGKHEIYVPIAEVADPTKFWASHNWGITAAKGFQGFEHPSTTT